jgi:hypothetical protein
MGEENLAEQMNDEQLPEGVDQQLEESHEEEQLNLSPVEQRAYDDGWRPEDQFEGNPDNWKTAGEYNLYGEMQTQVRDAKAETRRAQDDMDSRIASLNKLHAAQQTAAINDLKAKQRQAVEEADTALYDQLQTQIENTVVEPVQSAQPAKAPEITAWEAKNSWINDPTDDRTVQAQMFYGQASAKAGATYESVFKFVDDQLAKLYPEQQSQTNPRRESATMTEQSRQPRQRQRNNKELSMSDLTSQEAREYEMFGKEMFKDEKQFLKSVQDARKS